MARRQLTVDVFHDGRYMHSLDIFCMADELDYRIQTQGWEVDHVLRGRWHGQSRFHAYLVKPENRTERATLVFYYSVSA